MDKPLDQVLVNGQRKCALSEVRGVKLGQYVAPNGRNQPFSIRGLYLETVKGEAVEVERLTQAGPNRSDLKKVGLVIAEFAQVNNNLS